MTGSFHLLAGSQSRYEQLLTNWPMDYAIPDAAVAPWRNSAALLRQRFGLSIFVSKPRILAVP
jgi:hypothetical protein